MPFSRLFVFCWLAATAASASENPPLLSEHLGNLESFHQAVARCRQIQATQNPQWRSIEPAVYQFLLKQRSDLGALGAEDQAAFVDKLAGYLLALRQRYSDLTVLGPGRDILALLGQEDATQKEHVEKLSAAFKARSEVFRADDKQSGAETIAGFLAALAELANRGEPATIVMLGHGLPEQFKVTEDATLGCSQLAVALVKGAAPRARQGKIDLSALCLVMDACYSADYFTNLAIAIEQQAESQGLGVAALPVMAASASRNQLAHGLKGPRNYLVFWHSIAGFYVDEKIAKRRTLERITFGQLINEVDRRLYSLGRSPILDQRPAVIGWRIDRQDLLQDPVFFVPLREFRESEATELRQLLGLPNNCELPRLLEIG